jgi:hypothetical protein
MITTEEAKAIRAEIDELNERLNDRDSLYAWFVKLTRQMEVERERINAERDPLVRLANAVVRAQQDEYYLPGYVLAALTALPESVFNTPATEEGGDA